MRFEEGLRGVREELDGYRDDLRRYEESVEAVRARAIGEVVMRDAEPAMPVLLVLPVLPPAPELPLASIGLVIHFSFSWPSI